MWLSVAVVKSYEVCVVGQHSLQQAPPHGKKVVLPAIVSCSLTTIRRKICRRGWGESEGERKGKEGGKERERAFPLLTTVGVEEVEQLLSLFFTKT